MQNSLLAHIASNFISEYENVANSSIAYLLNHYPASREALRNILDIDRVPTYYVTELSTDKHGRPDVTGLDSGGGKAVIIEGKFWANLTPNQPDNYLKELTTEGKMLFLAPDKRLTSLTIEIEKRIGEAIDKVVVGSWASFLNLIETQNNKDHNPQLASDLIQIHELCRKMDVEGMPPLSASDLDPMNGKVASNFSDVIDECNAMLREWEHANFKGLHTVSKKYGHGFYFRGYARQCFLRFDSAQWFLRDNHTPIWLTVFESDQIGAERIRHYLNDFDAFNSFENDYGIVLREGMDKRQASTHIVDQVKKVLGYLDVKLTDA
jgi:hypothetical protein